MFTVSSSFAVPDLKYYVAETSFSQTDRINIIKSTVPSINQSPYGTENHFLDTYLVKKAPPWYATPIVCHSILNFIITFAPPPFFFSFISPTCIIHIYIPSLLQPGRVSGLLPGLEAFISWKASKSHVVLTEFSVNNVKRFDLRQNWVLAVQIIWGRVIIEATIIKIAWVKPQ